MTLPTSADFIDACHSEYRLEGVDIFLTSRKQRVFQKAHHPSPQCKGGVEVVPLLGDHHIIQGLLQSKEWDTRCFLTASTRAFLYGRGFLCDSWFELVEIYDHYKSFNTYVNPDTGEKVFCSPEQARQQGLVSVKQGKSLYFTEEGTIVSATRSDAQERGLVPVSKGKVTALDPVSGKTLQVSQQDYYSCGFSSPFLGKSSYFDPISCEWIYLSIEEAERRGICHVFSSEERAWLDPQTNQFVLATPGEASDRGLVGVRYCCDPVQIISPDGSESSYLNTIQASSALGVPSGTVLKWIKMGRPLRCGPFKGYSACWVST